MYQVLIVEDDAEAADSLQACLNRYAHEYALALHITRYESAIPLVTGKRTFDLVFLDIDLPGVNGMEAAELLRTYDKRTPIVFVTNLAQYAVRGYQVDALDFIVKPVSYYNFSMRMDKAVRAMRRNDRPHLSVTTRAGIRVLEPGDIVYVETVNHDLVYHLRSIDDEAEILRIRGSLSKLERELADGPFLRISSGCLVNMDHVRSMQAGMVRMSDGTTLYASRAKKRAALETFADYLGGSI